MLLGGLGGGLRRAVELGELPYCAREIAQSVVRDNVLAAAPYLRERVAALARPTSLPLTMPARRAARIIWRSVDGFLTTRAPTSAHSRGRAPASKLTMRPSSPSPPVPGPQRRCLQCAARTGRPTYRLRPIRSLAALRPIAL